VQNVSYCWNQSPLGVIVGLLEVVVFKEANFSLSVSYLLCQKAARANYNKNFTQDKHKEHFSSLFFIAMTMMMLTVRIIATSTAG